MRGERRSNGSRPMPMAGFGLVLMALVIAASLLWGPVRLPARSLAAFVTDGADGLSQLERTVLLDLRMPRVIAALLVGSVLGLAGAAMQGLFRNPLADPGLIGVTAGGSLGAVLQLKFGHAVAGGILSGLGLLMQPMAALAGGLAAVAGVVHLSKVHGATVLPLMILAGLAINSLCGALVGLTLFFSDDEQLRQITHWTLGSLGGATWERLAAVLPSMLAAVLLLASQTRQLNLLMLGEAEALHSGVDVRRAKRLLLLGAALGAGACVALAGGIAFIGLIAPHCVRLAVGADNRLVLPLSALLGALILLCADLSARLVAAPAELPVGVLLAALGAPLLLSQLYRHKRSS